MSDMAASSKLPSFEKTVIRHDTENINEQIKRLGLGQPSDLKWIINIKIKLNP